MKTKKIIKYVLASILIIAFWYMVFTFVSGYPDFRLWHELWRAFFVLLCIASKFLTSSIIEHEK